MNIFSQKMGEKRNFFALQWHITERCNWNCKHCYQEAAMKNELGIDQMILVLDKFEKFIKDNEIQRHKAILQFTGGEPLLHKDFNVFVDELHKRRGNFTWRLMTNGSLIDEERVAFLKERGMNKIQFSIEGARDINDSIRPIGSYEVVKRAVKCCVDAGVDLVALSLTLTNTNKNELLKIVEDFSPMAKFSTRIIVAAKRLVPIGSGQLLSKDIMSPGELKDFYLGLNEINAIIRDRNLGNIKVGSGCESGIKNDMNLSWRQNFCGVVGGNTLTLLPNGDVMICRRLPIEVGNILKQDFQEIYDHKAYVKLRNPVKNVSRACGVCNNFNKCFGGAKCVTYALTHGRASAPDVQCWKLFDSLQDGVDFCKKGGFWSDIVKTAARFDRLKE